MLNHWGLVVYGGLNNTKYIKTDRTEMRYHPYKPSVSTLEDCDHHNASKEFVQRSIGEHNNTVFAHNKQFDRVYDTIENVKKMKITPASLEMTGLDKVKYTLNANLTANVGEQKKEFSHQMMTVYMGKDTINNPQK